jgi:hypothetical protein
MNSLIILVDLILVYDYCYGSETLEAQMTRQQRPPSEDTLWCYLVQMVTALRAIHAIGPWRVGFHPSKILVQPLKRR